VPNLNFLAPTVPEIWKGCQNFKSISREPFWALLPNFAFLLVPLVVYMRAKFDVCSFTRSGDKEGVPKFQPSKVGHVTHFGPALT